MTQPLDPSDPAVADIHTAIAAAFPNVRVATQCGQCGQVDADPKVQILGLDEPHHNDCLPFKYRQLVVDSGPVAAAIVEACEGGLRGKELLTFIEEQDHTLNTPEA